MTGAGLRSAQVALDGARGAIERLDAARHSEENAADLIEAWDGAQSALRALIGVSALTDRDLIRDARQRNLLSLDEAHALVEFSAAAERSRDGTYQPSSADLDAARAGFHLLEAALLRGGTPMPGRTGSAAPTATPGSAPPAVPISPVPPPATTSGSWLARGIVLAAILAVVAAAAYYGLQYRGRVGHERRAVAAYRAGERSTAKQEFAAMASNDPKSPVPHVYLARIAREEGDPITAARELNAALTLDPENALALREMGAHLLALGNLDLARRFYVRAVNSDPKDHTALGYLACTLARLGRIEEAQRFFQRAGPGEWSGCVQTAMPMGTPGVIPAPVIPK